ncbi:MAG: hypothetical protein ACKOW9_01970, partial [Candidatus Paceibacterota bacterium]
MKKNAHIIAAIVSGFFAFLATNSATFSVAMVATAGVLFFELRHKATWVMPTLGLVALGILYSTGGHAEVVTHTAGHEAMNLVSLFLLLVGGSLTGTYLLPATNIAPVISRFLPSSRFFMPTVILFIGFVFGLFNPVIGIMVTLTLLDYEYANTPNSVRVSAAFVANAAAAASPISDVGYILTGAGITTNTWAFSLLFTAVMGVYIGILNPKTSSRSDKFSEKLNWGAISMFIAMIVITLFTMKSYGLVIGMSFAIIASAIFADNKDFSGNLASYAKNFAFLPILVLCWSIEA